MIYAFTMAFAVLSGWYDARDIRLKRDIDHGVRWAFRAMVVGIASCIAMMFTDRPVWHVLPLAVGCGFLFSFVFRLSLNLWRGEWWWYMGARLDKRGEGTGASIYDTLWHFLAWVSAGCLGKYDPYYPERLPAILAYAFELVVFALTVWWACLHR